jgi:acyl carrier protein
MAPSTALSPEEARGTVCAMLRTLKRVSEDVRIPAELLESRFLSSMQAVELIVALEDHLNIRFGEQPDDFERLNDLEGLIRLVAERGRRT